MTTPSTPAPRREDALEACAREINQLCADLTGLALDDDEGLVAIMRSHGLRGPTELELEVEEIAAAITPEMMQRASEAFLQKVRQASERARTPEEP